nr:uncharacterized protein LOC117279062 isoform X2 [Nicotiana tomentosiformis]
MIKSVIRFRALFLCFKYISSAIRQYLIDLVTFPAGFVCTVVANDGHLIHFFGKCFIYAPHIKKWLLSLHCITWNRDAPHSAGLPMNDSAVKFTNGPPSGISPMSPLYETLKYMRCSRFLKDLGIMPDSLLLDRSTYSNETKSSNDSAMKFSREKDQLPEPRNFGRLALNLLPPI